MTFFNLEHNILYLVLWYGPLNFDSQFFVPYQRPGHYMLVVLDLINKVVCYFDNVDKHIEFFASGVVRLHLFFLF